MLARLFTQPANLLVMDEPTNDLDVETLELLEELLAEYSGTLLLVSHDRAFLDNVVTSTLVFEGDGRIGEYVGGYADWLRQRAVAKPEAKPAAPKQVPAKAAEPAKRRKLSYKEQRELETLPDRIEALETEQQALQAQISQPSFYQQDNETVSATLARCEELEQELEQCLERWEALESG
jgi:ATP-binding cassette subfamily F protein uup